MKPKLLVSACLLGTPCRYDGKSKKNEAVCALAERFELIPVCPEVLGGLPTPRTPSSHGHTAGALQTISYLSLLTVVLASLATVPMAAFSGLKLFVALSTSKSQAPTLQAYSLRAPPIG